jgi:radical SAM superfamily enzyme YgiQ (UPF0313 family)
MSPPIAPIGLDYVASHVRSRGIAVHVLDLNLAADAATAMRTHFENHEPELIGLSLRNVDDCFWPSAASFLPAAEAVIAQLRELSQTPIVLGGVGFSIFAESIVRRSGGDFGIRGDGEEALVELLRQLRGDRSFERVPGLLWRDGPRLRVNPPAWPTCVEIPTARDAVDNPTYFARGGQVGIETKRGCPRQCAYCADPLAKGNMARLRPPRDVADEFAALLAQGVDVLHLCDCEFNLPREHAVAVCDELIARRMGQRVRWYAYLAVVPFDDELCAKMARAGCVGINFTSDAAHPVMLAAYRQPHLQTDLANAVQLCRKHRIAVMLDMLLGGPGETPETLAHTIGYFRSLPLDCAGAGMGLRIYPGTPMERTIAAEGPMEANPAIRRRYEGPIDLARPTFYISTALGTRPARLARELIGGDPRFFPPEEEPDPAADGQSTQRATDHNYNSNRALEEAIAAGARGAYWDILRRLRAAAPNGG